MQLLGTGRYELLRRAFVASLAVHVCVAYLIPVWTHSLSLGDQPVETISVAKIARIHIERPKSHEPLPKVTAPHTSHRDTRIHFARVRTELTKNANTKSRRTPPQMGPRGEYASAPKAVNVQSQVPLVAQAAENTPSVAATPPDQSATPVPRATSGDRDVASNGTHETGGVMPFGASMNEPVLDPHVRQVLAQKFRVHVTLIVTVGDDGKTKKVEFDPPIDPDTERAISAILATANWDAAVCGGGIACEGRTRITL